MSDEIEIIILGKEIPVKHESMPIETLKYLLSNPRVHSALYGHGHKLPDDAEERQELVAKACISYVHIGRDRKPKPIPGLKTEKIGA